MLRRVAICGIAWGCGLMLALPAVAQQQGNSAPAQQSQTTGGDQKPANSNPKKDEKKPSTAAQNPFPEAQSEAAAKQQEQDSDPSAPVPQGGGQPNRSTADQNPFPEAQSEKATHQGEQPDQNQSGGAGSSGKGDYSSSQVKGLGIPDTNAKPTGGPSSSLAYNPTLAKKDVQVGIFYLQTGDFKGAYDRFQEATRSDPGSAEAVFGLAESARRLGKPDEALRNYELYLSAVPDGPHAKEVRKAMKQLGAEPPA